METNNQLSQLVLQSGSVDYAAALRQYNKYGRGRSMNRFCGGQCLHVLRHRELPAQ